MISYAHLDGGGGGNYATTVYHVPGTPITIKNPAHSVLVNRTITGLISALANDADCASWLSTGSGRDDVRMSGGISGYLNNLRSVAGSALISDPTVAGLEGPYAPGFSVLFNTQGGFFMGSDTIDMPTRYSALASTNFDSNRAREFFLLHELGHLLGAPGFADNDQTVDLQRANNDDLWMHCDKTILSFSNVSGH